ncbi:MAG: GNAT family N-acetyltransferase [Pseudomonadota bacterium]
MNGPSLRKGALTVRALCATDRGEWEDLFAGYNAFYGREGETALPLKIVDETWRRLLDEHTPIAGLVAETDKGLVGLAHAVFHLNLIQTAETCYMQDLYTAPGARGSGVGRTLIDGVCELCRARGVSDVYWHTHESNAAARGLYDRLARDTGFVVYRIKPL